MSNDIRLGASGRPRKFAERFFSSRAVASTLAALGLSARLATAIIGGQQLFTPFSGKSDAAMYVTLAANLRGGDGFTYAHIPTAFRPPLYPMLLAALMWLSPEHWLVALRAIQFLTALATAWACAWLAARWFGPRARTMAFAIVLLLPTQLYFTGEVLTECTASLFGILFFVFLARCLDRGGDRDWILLGLVTGAAVLERFNFAGLAIVAGAVAVGWPLRVRPEGRGGAPGLRPLALFCVSCAMAVAPWLAHTAVAFQGRALYSTHAGFAAVEGVLSPTGRADSDEVQKIDDVLGWDDWAVETNAPSRPDFRNEVELNRQAWTVAGSLWRKAGWSLVPIEVEKTGAFWFSVDQFFQLRTFSPMNRVLRRVGVAAYWLVLALAIAGWFRLRALKPDMARVLLFSAIVVTVIHLPLTMNARLRSSLFDPLLATLAAGGLPSGGER